MLDFQLQAIKEAIPIYQNYILNDFSFTDFVTLQQQKKNWLNRRATVLVAMSLFLMKQPTISPLAPIT